MPAAGNYPMDVRQSTLSAERILRRLERWDIAAIGLHPGGSNYVFVVRLEPPEDAGEQEGEEGAEPLFAVYKPQAGERPLRDFPPGSLHRRERAAYVLAESLGWPAIPPTVVRGGPYGPGSVQLFIDAEPEQNFFTLRDTDLAAFEPVAAFDVLVNNADRKGSSCLKDSAGRLWAIDHGLTFNPFARPRTVMHEFCGRTYSARIVASLETLQGKLGPSGALARALDALLEPGETDALRARLARMLEEAAFPLLDPRLNVPWPFL